MLPFAQTPAKMPFRTFKMAAIKYIIYAILASTQPRNVIKYANPMFSGSRNPIKISKNLTQNLVTAPPSCGQGNNLMLLSDMYTFLFLNLFLIVQCE